MYCILHDSCPVYIGKLTMYQLLYTPGKMLCKLHTEPYVYSPRTTILQNATSAHNRRSYIYYFSVCVHCYYLYMYMCYTIYVSNVEHTCICTVNV